MRVGLAGAACRDRRAQDHRLALEQEAGAERERAAPTAPVLQGQGVEVAVDRDDLAAPVRGDLLDHRAELGDGLDRAAALGHAPVGGQDVGPVAVSHAQHARCGAVHRAAAHAARPGDSDLPGGPVVAERSPAGASSVGSRSVLGVVVLASAVGRLPSWSSSPGSLSPAVSPASSPSASGLSSPGRTSSGSWSSSMPWPSGSSLEFVMAGKYPPHTSGSRFWLRGRCS